MSSFTPINARQVEEKKRAQARQRYWWDEDETKRNKEEEAAVKAETEATVAVETKAIVEAEHKAPAQAAAERPIVEERARGKANNMKTCSRCNGKEYNMSNFGDHIKVHVLEENGEMQLQWAQDGAA
ncbi:hypothetical protein FMEXI_2483 [Fusarium mexicanum]|uniref:Uncharacterized protein n=1 Tax=Fusarium mexicanum TaxID=751941 RepID=A0A8H5JDF5_9HYPO|nr:hypothetical protein FMEXI_2483 [Fusarium mexicanum]